jgi:hypothetical protein
MVRRWLRILCVVGWVILLGTAIVWQYRGGLGIGIPVGYLEINQGGIWLEVPNPDDVAHPGSSENPQPPRRPERP